MLRFLISFLAAAILSSGSAAAEDGRSGRFVFSAWSGPSLDVYYVEPSTGVMEDAPVVIVLHGVDRNADDYAENWRPLAERYGLRVYVPEFPSRSFPGAAFYNLGGVGTDGPFAYSAVEPLFRAIVQRGGAPDGYYLFGHSAGAQYVHRALLFEDLPHLNQAYAANAGWYTLPDASIPWPYGLRNVPMADGRLEAWMAAPLVLLLGERDTDPEHRHLRRTPEADAQGPHRFARGIFFAAEARARAGELGAPFAWSVISVPGIAHDNAGMAEAAAALIAAGRTPDAGRDR